MTTLGLSDPPSSSASSHLSQRMHAVLSYVGPYVSPIVPTFVKDYFGSTPSPEVLGCSPAELKQAQEEKKLLIARLEQAEAQIRLLQSRLRIEKSLEPMTVHRSKGSAAKDSDPIQVYPTAVTETVDEFEVIRPTTTHYLEGCRKSCLKELQTRPILLKPVALRQSPPARPQSISLLRPLPGSTKPAHENFVDVFRNRMAARHATLEGELPKKLAASHDAWD